MARPSSVSSRTLVVLLSSTLALACNSEQKKAQPTPTKTGATGAPVGTPPPGTDTPPAPTVVPPGPSAKVELPGGGTIHALTSEPEILGHFMIASGSRLLNDVKTQLLPSRQGSMLDENTLRMLAGMALDKRAAMAQAFDLAQPMGCALVDPKPPEPKVACTFGYRGGAKAFINDLGDQNKHSDPGEHEAAYKLDDKVSMYVDDVDGQVVVSSGNDTIKTTKAYLQRNIIGRASDVHGDLEMVVYVATLFDRYQKDIEPLIDMFSGGMGATPPPTGNPALDGAVAAFTNYQKRSTKTGLSRIAEMQQLTVFFSVEPAGVMLGGAMFPKAGTRMAQEAAQYGGRKLDAAFAGSAPAGTALLAAFNNNPAMTQSESAAEMRKLLGEVWAPIAGGDAASVEAAITAFQTENAGLYDGQNVFALGGEGGAPMALMIGSHLQTGKSARDAWKAWTQKFTPQNVLGANFSQYVSWKFTPDSNTIDGVPVDRWTIEPGPAVAKQLDTQMPADAKAMVDKVLGGMFLHIDRAEVGGTVITTLAPKAEANYMKRAIAAVQGKGNAGTEPGLARVLARDPEAVGVIAVDVRQVLAMVKNLSAYGAKTESLPNLGTDLGDFYATFRYSADGTSAMEYVFSQQLIDQIKTLIPG